MARPRARTNVRPEGVSRSMVSAGTGHALALSRQWASYSTLARSDRNG